MNTATTQNEVYIEPMWPMDIPGEGGTLKLGKVRVREKLTGKPVQLTELIGLSGRGLRGMTRLFHYDTVYVIAAPSAMHRFVQDFLEDKGFTVVAPPSSIKR